jgi:leucyl aminopeptidase
VTRVEFYADGGLKGTDTTAPYSYALDTTTLPNGSHRISSKAFDAADNSGGSLDVNVTVNNQTAVFSAALRAPTCGTVAGLCDSGPTLLNGRDGKGPEPNQPNTINGTCADGTQGVYHSDESTDRVRVLTTDGLPFAAGKMVRVEATVWAWTTPSADKLDLYYAADALGPVWTLIGTLTPPGAGSRVLSTTYTLPTGSLQAVRARFRYQGSATSCSAGSYNDHDDLVFAVQ